ncbi:HNH endonuclease [Bradyrhizobium sp. 31Argb]|uniref:HNH endonuclease n=1 Tax=Bradyrhizobium sp. 31Argb TaxID=3141247 RepID=UPI003749547B
MDPTSTRVKWQHFYTTAFWLRRRKLQLKHHPLCKLCLGRGVVTRATVADHVVPHRGDWNKFCLGELQSLCADCHNSEKKHIESRGYGGAVDDDGWPTDPKHPANRIRR